MGNTKQYADDLSSAFQKIQDLNHMLSGNEYGYKLTSVIANHNSLFDRFCPFKIGDRVTLLKTPEISDTVAWGWIGSKHFLTEGAIGTIHSVDYYRNLFQFGVQFDDDSWISSSDGIVHPTDVDRRGSFLFSEEWLGECQ
jgi:hypothetical protein